MCSLKWGLDLHPFIEAYIATALWADFPEDAAENAELSVEAKGAMVKDATLFLNENMDLLNLTPEDYDYGNAGLDFWLTRNGHGAGFWDGGCGIVGVDLTAKADEYPHQDLYVGDDGLIYIQ